MYIFFSFNKDYMQSYTATADAKLIFMNLRHLWADTFVTTRALAT